MAYPIQGSGQASAEGRVVQELSIPLFQAKGWLKFLGVISILAGVLQAISIVGILFAWLPIWMGVLMYQAGSNIEPAAQFGDRFAFLRSVGSLKTYFVLNGILSLLSILAALAAVCIMVVLPLLGVTLIPWQEILENSQYYLY